VHATLERPIPYLDGFQLIDNHLKGIGLPRQALCGLELRCPAPYTPEGFRDFNVKYAVTLREWGLYGGAVGTGSTTRTNIAPARHPPTEQVLFAFSYTVPSTSTRPTFVISGAGAWDLPQREPSADADRAYIARTVEILEERLKELGVSWDLTTEVVAYEPRDLQSALRAEVLPKIGPAVLNGIRWFPGSAPVIGHDIEMGAHGVRQEVRVGER
jgi:hypothetical protein